MDLCPRQEARFVVTVMQKHPFRGRTLNLISKVLIWMKFILGTKERMTQVFDAQGNAHPVTVLRATPAKITQVRAKDKDGYEAVQVASGAQKERRLSKAQRGHQGAHKHVAEFRPRTGIAESVSGLEKGALLDVSVFAEGDRVMVSAISKGKGFQGVVKRHGFRGGPGSHGTKDTLRAPGSIGATGAQRVFKGLRMAGRMGGDRVTVKNLKVIAVNKEENLLLISGAVPGRRGALVEVRSI
jgi:large subunit ribosomal protein L3